MNRTLTGWHIFGIFAFCFGIIIAVNLTLAFQAVSTFPGVVTKNSYVASQHFDADKQAQDALGWTLETEVQKGVLTVAITDVNGTTVRPQKITATLGRATHVADDVIPAFTWDGLAHTAVVDVEPGYWTLWLNMTAEDGTPFRRRIPMTVRDEPAT